MSGRKPRGGSRRRPRRKTKDESPTEPKRRRRRAIPRPVAWLMSRRDLDEMARRRCILVLSMLSGETTIAEAAEAGECSPLTVQKYEKQALEAMLAALTPKTGPDGLPTSSARRITDLETRIAQLERDKRRMERLLALTRQLVRPGPVATAAGRRPGSRSRRKSEAAGEQPSTTPKRPRGRPRKEPRTAPAMSI